MWKCDLPDSCLSSVFSVSNNSALWVFKLTEPAHNPPKLQAGAEPLQVWHLQWAASTLAMKLLSCWVFSLAGHFSRHETEAANLQSAYSASCWSKHAHNNNKDEEKSN